MHAVLRVASFVIRNQVAPGTSVLKYGCLSAFGTVEFVGMSLLRCGAEMSRFLILRLKTRSGLTIQIEVKILIQNFFGILPKSKSDPN